MNVNRNRNSTDDLHISAFFFQFQNKTETKKAYFYWNGMLRKIASFHFFQSYSKLGEKKIAD